MDRVRVNATVDADCVLESFVVHTYIHTYKNNPVKVV